MQAKIREVGTWVNNNRWTAAGILIGSCLAGGIVGYMVGASVTGGAIVGTALGAGVGGLVVQIQQLKNENILLKENATLHADQKEHLNSEKAKNEQQKTALHENARILREKDEEIARLKEQILRQAQAKSNVHAVPQPQATPTGNPTPEPDPIGLSNSGVRQRTNRAANKDSTNDATPRGGPSL